MRKKFVLKFAWPATILVVSICTIIACTTEDDDLDACNCTFYPEINQYLPQSLTADDVIGEDTYYSGKELRELNRKCVEFCE